MVFGPARPFVRRPWLAAVLAAVIVAALVVTFVIRPWSSKEPDQPVADPAPGDRVVQSVNVAMQDDGSLTGVNDTVVIARGQGGKADTVSATYDPSKVVDQLPVRVLTSYRTDKGAGTRLADLKGYTGRVTIDLTVENLTVKPQRLRYDVAGRSRTTTAMVGAPLTVVASAAMPGIGSSDVLTSATDSAADGATNGPVTNGVLSQSADNTTQVQWATILAPPQLDSTATLRLVVDAKDFTLPTFNLSVQPGLVTDASVGALVDAAFNPKNSDELALQSRTIKVIGDVNAVLGRASDTIAKVRGTLDSTSKTLGTKTVNALKTNAENVTTSMKTSRENVDALGKDLSSQLKSTNSETLARMSETVSQLDQLLGDTSVAVPTPKVTGSGCDQKVEIPGQANSVYANLLGVVAQLDGYAAATDGCKTTLQKSILDSIGPAEPTDETCTTSSVTCSLAGVESTFVQIAEQFVADGQQALTGLDPDNLDPVTISVDGLITQLGDIVEATDALLVPDQLATTRTTLGEISSTLSAAGDSVTALTKALADVHQDALDGAEQATSMSVQNADLATQLCDLIGAPTEPGKLPALKVEELRSYLATRSCPDADGNTVALIPPVKYGAAMASRLSDQAAAFARIAAATDTEDTDQGTGLALAQLNGQLATVNTQVAGAVAALDTGDKALKDKVAALRASAAQAQQDLEDLKGDVGGVKTDFAAVKAKLDAALQQAGDNAKANAENSLDPEIRRIAEQGQADTEQLGEMFERSAAGLSAAADKIKSDGASTVKEQRDALQESQARASKTLSAGTEAALSQVSNDVSTATRDLDATKALLTRDLANVLLDLGNRKVRGSGVLGALATSADAAGSADYQLGLASDKTSAYAAVRARDVNAILMRQAQAEAALERQADLPAFVRILPPTVTHRTVYAFHLAGGR